MNFCDLGKVTDASQMVRAPRRLAKATIQRGGRLGFSKTGGELMGLAADKRLLIVVGDPGGKELFVKVVDESDERGFRLIGTSGYFSMPAREFLESLHIDYASQTTTHIYDIAKLDVDDADGSQIWKFALRSIETNRRTVNKEENPLSESV